MENGMWIPVAAGLVIGIAFIVVFSIFSSSTSSIRLLPDNDRLSITVDGLNDAYRVWEPISFTVNTNGISNNLCNEPKLHVQIIRLDDDEAVWYTPPTFQTAMECGNVQGIDRDWRFGYADEELPYQSALTYDKYYDNNIVMKKDGTYKMSLEFDDHVIEKEFHVISSTSGKSVYAEQVPEGTTIEIEIHDADNE